jgi:hypothetical protein
MGAVGGEQQGFAARGDRRVGLEQQLADLPADGRGTGLVGDQDGMTRGAQAGGEGTDLTGLAGPFTAFEGDQDATGCRVVRS